MITIHSHINSKFNSIQIVYQMEEEIVNWNELTSTEMKLDKVMLEKGFMRKISSPIGSDSLYGAVADQLNVLGSKENFETVSKMKAKSDLW